MLSVRLTKDPILINDDNFREYLKRIRKYQLISREEEVELLLRAKKGDDKAIDRLLKANLRFVVSVAKRFAASNPTTNVNDLISAGNLGLYEAIISFKKEKIGQCKLISYAIFHITKRIREEIHNNFSILKMNGHDKILITKVMNMMKYDSTLSYEDAISIVLKKHNLSEKKKQDLKLAIQNLSTIPLSEVLHYQKELDDYNYEDLAYDEKEFEKVLDDQAIKKFVHKVLDNCVELYPYKKICFDIVKLHHGISTKYPMTQKEIAIQLSISVDKVRNYYREGIKIIRDFIIKNQNLTKDAMALLINV